MNYTFQTFLKGEVNFQTASATASVGESDGSVTLTVENTGNGPATISE